MSLVKHNPDSNKRFTLASKYVGMEGNVWNDLDDCDFEDGPNDEIIDLGVGFPDYQPAEEIITYLAEICRPNCDYLYHQYARAFGQPRLVKALAAFYSHLIQHEIEPMSEVIITQGGYGALYYAIMSNIGPGDEVIIIEPYFDCYEPFVKLAGGIPIYISLKQTTTGADENNNKSSSVWKLDMAELAGLFNAKTKAIILNTPNNPLGKVFTKEELTEIGALCQKYNVLVIADEVYEFIVFDNNQHVRMASLEGMWDRTITIGSAGKAFSLTGWKLGWAYGPSHLIRNLQIAHQNCTDKCHTPEQEAVAVAFENELARLGTPSSFFHKLVTNLTQRRNLIVQNLEATGFKPVVPQGGYFVLANWRGLEPKAKTMGLESIDDARPDYRFVKWLRKVKKLQGIPPSAFYNTKENSKDFIRFNFYKKFETLEKAHKILQGL